MHNLPEGGYPEQTHHVTAPPPSVVINPEDLYYGGKRSMDSWLSTLKRFDASIHAQVEQKLTHTGDLATHDVARIFRDISRILWSHNGFASAGFFSLFMAQKDIPIQEKCNDRLWTRNEDGTLNHITSETLMPLFAPGKQADWPNLVLTSNHARAWQSKDLSELVEGVEQFAGDAWHTPLDIYRPGETAAQGSMKNKTIVALACHTERDMYLNGSELIERRLALEEDGAGKRDPAKRTLKHMSPAAMRLAKLIMKLMVEPDANGAMLVDLDQAKREHMAAPFIAQSHDHPLVLRQDATSIAQHIKLDGFSRGANTVTDVLRFLFREYTELGERLQVRGKDGSVHTATDADMETIISNIGLLNIAPGEVPLTEAEKQRVGIRRTTILNTHDLTAGHLVNPNSRDYDRVADHLVKIDGTLGESGHGVTDTLGRNGVPGFIMDPANESKPGYRLTQDEARAHFASNHGIHAITSFRVAAEEADNVLYVQFAPGVSKGHEADIAQHMRGALKKKGFADPIIESDLTHHRRLRIVLDHRAADQPLVNEAGNVGLSRRKLKQCREAMQAIADTQGNELFVTSAALAYLAELEEKTPEPSVTGGEAASSGRVKPRSLPAMSVRKVG